jgi:hypothetical protein
MLSEPGRPWTRARDPSLEATERGDVMGKKDKAQQPETVITDQPLTAQPSGGVVEQTDAHLEGHGTDD